MPFTGSEMLSDLEPVRAGYGCFLAFDQVKCQQQCLHAWRFPPKIHHGVDGGGGDGGGAC